MTTLKIYMFGIKFNINYHFNTVVKLVYHIFSNVVIEKAVMYKNGPRSLGRGHQSEPWSPKLLFY